MWPTSKYKAGCGRIWHAAWTSTIVKHQKHLFVRCFIFNSITEIGTGCCCGFWDVVELLSWGFKITFFLFHRFGSFFPSWKWNFNDVHTSCEVYHRGNNPLGDILSLHWSIMIYHFCGSAICIVGYGWKWLHAGGICGNEISSPAVHIIPKNAKLQWNRNHACYKKPSTLLENITPSKSTSLMTRWKPPTRWSQTNKVRLLQIPRSLSRDP